MTLLKYFFTLIILHTCITEYSRASTIQASQCEEVKQSYLNMGYSSLDVPLRSVVLKGDDLQICPSGLSCCNRDMEVQLAENSRQKFDSELATVLDPFIKMLNDSTRDFHSFFSHQIEKAKKDLDAMFTLVYTDKYTDNKGLFMNLYKKFREYYDGGDINLDSVINQFYKDLFVKLFTIQSPTVNYTATYLQCVRSKFDVAKPFKDAPEKTRRNLKQALIASRTFVQGLAIAKDTAIHVQKIEPMAVCTKAHMKMTFCSHCRGLPNIKPCYNYCMNVMSGCLAYKNELNATWVSYIDALDKLALRLESEGSFNLESVLRPLKDHFSTIIMDYDKDKTLINNEIYKVDVCGPPPAVSSSASKSKRDIPGLASLLPIRHTSASRLRPRIMIVRRQLRALTNLWGRQLVKSMCKELEANSTSSHCWNGESEASYSKSVVDVGLQANSGNPEVTFDVTRSDESMNVQKVRLNLMISRINDAMKGENVAWVKLLIPLPNVNSTVETSISGISVKSSLLNSNLASWIGSGSGYYSNIDDEDTEGSGKLTWPIVPIPKPYDMENSGSGDIVSTLAPIHYEPGVVKHTQLHDQVSSTQPPQPDESIVELATEKPYEVQSPTPENSASFIHSTSQLTIVILLLVLCNSWFDS